MLYLYKHLNEILQTVAQATTCLGSVKFSNEEGKSVKVNQQKNTTITNNYLSKQRSRVGLSKRKLSRMTCINSRRQRESRRICKF